MTRHCQYSSYLYKPATILALMLFSSPALADNSGQCLQLFYMKQYARALNFCTLAAKEGDSHAQYALGLIYSDGLGTAKNRAEAIKWLRAAADQSYAAAHYRLEKLENESEQPKLATLQQLRTAQNSAALGNPQIGPRVSNKDSVTRSESIPYRAKTAPDVQPGTAKTLPKEEQPARTPHLSDRERLLEYLTLAKQGNAHARLMLGLYYLEGRAIAQNSEEGLKQIQLAANQGDSQAQYTLGLIYAHGHKGIPTDLPRARSWLGKAAKSGHRDAQYSLGLLHLDNRDDKGHIAKAIHWFHKAADQKHPGAQHNLAVINLKGLDGIQPDRKLALQFFIEEAEQGDPEAQFNLGRLYSEGKWMPVSSNDAASWFYRAGESWLAQQHPDRTDHCIEKIRALAGNQPPASNLFLADVLEQKLKESGYHQTTAQAAE